MQLTLEKCTANLGLVALPHTLLPNCEKDYLGGDRQNQEAISARNVLDLIQSHQAIVSEVNAQAVLIHGLKKGGAGTEFELVNYQRLRMYEETHFNKLFLAFADYENDQPMHNDLEILSGHKNPPSPALMDPPPGQNSDKLYARDKDILENSPTGKSLFVRAPAYATLGELCDKDKPVNLCQFFVVRYASRDDPPLLITCHMGDFVFPFFKGYFADQVSLYATTFYKECANQAKKEMETQ